MDFGKVDKPDSIDFTLPPDHKDTATLLKRLKKDKKVKPQVYVGCAKWGRKDWIGKIYPEGTKEKDFLDSYVKQFNAIELNATHYKIPDIETVKKWKSKAGNDFKFCPKFPQLISHIKRLKGADELTASFLEAIQGFEENLGVCFLQLPPNFSPKNLQVLEDYLKSLPKEIEVCVEFRHPDWFKPLAANKDAFEMLENYKMGTVITDTAGRRDCVHQRLTTSTAFIRFVGNNLHPTDYTRINDWVMKIKEWLESGIRTVYFFMHQPEEAYSPELCAYVIRELNKHCHLQFKEPLFLTRQIKQPDLFTL